MIVNKETIELATKKNFSNATEKADYLANKGISFRKAHGIVGKLVLNYSKKGGFT